MYLSFPQSHLFWFHLTAVFNRDFTVFFINQVRPITLYDCKYRFLTCSIFENNLSHLASSSCFILSLCKSLNSSSFWNIDCSCGTNCGGNVSFQKVSMCQKWEVVTNKTKRYVIFTTVNYSNGGNWNESLSIWDGGR